VTRRLVEYDALVVGAGPAGSATAARLAAHGHHVALWERAHFPRPKPCAEYLSPGSVAALSRLGALAAVEREGPSRLSGMRVVGPDGSGFTGRFSRGYGLALARERLDSVLAGHAQARGADLEEGVTFESLVADGKGLLVRGRRGAGQVVVRTRLLVGADGLNSRVATRLGLARRGRLRRVALVAHMSGIRGMSGIGEMHVGGAGYVGLAPLGGGVTNVALVVDRRRGEVTPPLEDALRFQLSQVPTLRGRIERAELASPVRSVGPFGRTTRQASAVRALLVGDSADFYDPFTGEGVYSALRGAELAADTADGALGADRLDAASLGAYDRARRRTFAAKWTLERIVAWVIARPWALAHVARRLAREPALGDALVSVTAHVAPATQVFRPSYVWSLVR
jgi:flavin-dependent dehydrogenase